MSWKDYKVVASGLKTLYQAPTEEAALLALDAFAKVQIIKSWPTHLENLNALFSYPPDIGKAIIWLGSQKMPGTKTGLFTVRHASSVAFFFGNDGKLRLFSNKPEEIYIIYAL